MLKYIIAKYKKFACWIGWHSHPEFANYRQLSSPNDPLKFLVFAECRWCGYQGMLDSQGNLF